MTKKTGRAKSRLKISFPAALLAVFVVLGGMMQTMYAEEKEQADTAAAPEAAPEAELTIMFYCCGSDLETKSGMATHNLHQFLRSNFSAEGSVKFIALTGGAGEWHLESEHLYDPVSGTNPKAISGERNQLWEVMGADAPEHPGQMILLDQDGVTEDGAGATIPADALMSDPETLKAFINYGVSRYPAKKYDLIFWDHGAGPAKGFGEDSREEMPVPMPLSGIIDAVSDNDVIRGGKKFDMINFDACLMNTAELLLAMSDYCDCYVGSAETEPGTGQSHEGWLNQVGLDPSYDACELGRIIVDDYYEYYAEGEGRGQDAVLAVVDMEKLVNSGFVSALIELNGFLNDEAEGGRFYDELAAARDSVRYGGRIIHGAYDLKNLAALLAVAGKEVDRDHLNTSEAGKETNVYADVSRRLQTVLEDEDIIYSRATDKLVSRNMFYKDKNGDIHVGDLYSGGMYLFFPEAAAPGATAEYCEAMRRAVEKMPEGEKRDFLEEYPRTAAKYSLIVQTGNTVNSMMGGGTVRDEVNYDTVKAAWQQEYQEGNETLTLWDQVVYPLMTQLGGEEQVREWLSELILKQREEAVSRNDITSCRIIGDAAAGDRITIENTSRKVIDGIQMKLVAELPFIEEMVRNEEFLAIFYEAFREAFEFPMGIIEGEQSVDDLLIDPAGSEDEILDSYLEWYNKTDSIWDIPRFDGKWYALQDAQGNLYAAPIEHEKDSLKVRFFCNWRGDDADGGYLIFDRAEDSDTDYVLSRMSLSVDPATGTPIQIRTFLASELKIDLCDTIPVLVAPLLNGYLSYPIPVCETGFDITPENVDSIRLVYTDISDIPGIEDTDNDGKAYKQKYVVKDIYCTELDITDIVNEPAGEKHSILDAVIRPAVYNGEEQEPVVECNGKVLVRDTDYTLSAFDTLKEAGEHFVSVTGIGEYAGTLPGTFTITPAQ